MAWLWLAGVVAFSGDALAHPLVAVVLLVLVFIGCTLTTLALRHRPELLIAAPYVIFDLTLAVALYTGDGFVYEPGHVFATSQNLAGQWPLIAVLHAAVALGPWAVAAGAAVGASRYVGAIGNRFEAYSAKHHVSVASSVVFLAVAGGVGASLVRVLRRVETEVLARRARDDVARTLHDTVLQTLAVVEQRTATRDPELAAIARRSDRELRAYLFGAAAQPSQDTLEAGLRAAVERVQGVYDIPVVVNVIDEGGPTDSRRVHALAGAVGEAVANAAQHAQATRIVVFAETDDAGDVFATVNDDGVGFDVEAALATATHRGLIGSIVGRMVDADGRAEVVSVQGQGTEIRLWTR